ERRASGAGSGQFAPDGVFQLPRDRSACGCGEVVWHHPRSRGSCEGGAVEGRGGKDCAVAGGGVRKRIRPWAAEVSSCKRQPRIINNMLTKNILLSILNAMNEITSQQQPSVMTLTFPAMHGVMGKRDYYVAIMKLALIPKLFKFRDWAELPPEQRAQRVIQK